MVKQKKKKAKKRVSICYVSFAVFFSSSYFLVIVVECLCLLNDVEEQDFSWHQGFS